MADVISLMFSDNHSPSEAYNAMDKGDVLLARNTDYANTFRSLANDDDKRVNIKWQRNPEAWRITLLD